MTTLKDVIDALSPEQLRARLLVQMELMAELHANGACKGYSTLLAQMDRIGNILIGSKHGHYDGAEVEAAAISLKASSRTLTPEDTSKLEDLMRRMGWPVQLPLKPRNDEGETR